METTTQIRSSVELGEIATAIAQVIAQVNRVPKNGDNTFDRYMYATESDLLDAVRAPLAAAGVAVFTSSEVVHEETYETKRKDLWRRLRVRLVVRMVHKSGQWIETVHVGEGEDRGDKAAYKAITGATKYWVMKTFLISTGDDPESGQQSQGRPAQGQGGPQRQGRRQPPRQVGTPQQQAVARRVRMLTEAVRDLEPDEARSEAIEYVATQLAQDGAYSDRAFALGDLKKAGAGEMNGKEMAQLWVRLEQERSAKKAA